MLSDGFGVPQLRSTNRAVFVSSLGTDPDPDSVRVGHRWHTLSTPVLPADVTSADPLLVRRSAKACEEKGKLTS